MADDVGAKSSEAMGTQGGISEMATAVEAMAKGNSVIIGRRYGREHAMQDIRLGQKKGSAYSSVFQIGIEVRRRRLRMATMGSIAEGQEFFASREKPPCGFRDRSPARLMAGRGWIGEWLLSKLHQGAGTVIASLLCRNVRDEF